MSNEKIGRNDPCPCGSGKKYKKCCGPNAVPLTSHGALQPKTFNTVVPMVGVPGDKASKCVVCALGKKRAGIERSATDPWKLFRMMTRARRYG